MNDSNDEKKLKASERPHYVNNADFSKAIVDYVITAQKAKTSGRPPAQITEYIGESLLKIAEGLSRKPNFVRYSYREDMVMDGVENCIRAIPNFKVSTNTRTGLPNAFAYFTQICFFAFIRRIQKEKRCQETKLAYIEHAGIDAFANFGEDGSNSNQVGEGIVERVRQKADLNSSHQGMTSKKTTLKKKERKQTVCVSSSSSLETFI